MTTTTEAADNNDETLLLGGTTKTITTTTTTSNREEQQNARQQQVIDGVHIELLAKSTDLYCLPRHQETSDDDYHTNNNNNNYNNFLLSGCSFSPDGSCILTYGVNDSKFRLYNTRRPISAGGSTSSNNNNNAAASAIADDSIATTTTTKDTGNKDDGSDEKDDNQNDDVNGGEDNENEQRQSANWNAVLTCSPGEAVRSYQWYPHMNSSTPATCCFVSAARNQPVHLFDAYTGALRASYCPYNELDEMESPCVVTFTPDGQQIVAGGFRTDRTIHVFDTAVPGRQSTTILRLGKTRRSSDGQKGLVSAIDICGNSSSSKIMAIGTYAPGSIYLYDLRTNQPSGTILDNGNCIVGHGRNHSRKKRRYNTAMQHQQLGGDGEKGQDDENGDDINNDWFSAAKLKWFHSRTRGGVTQLKFAPNNEDHILYSTSRRSNAILSWDIRMMNSASATSKTACCCVNSYEVDNSTNQRLEFDLDDSGNRLYAGDRNGSVRIYDVKSGNLLSTVKTTGATTGTDVESDAANGVSCYGGASDNQSYLLAVATGSRHFPSEEDLDLDPIPLAGTPKHASSGSLRLYELKYKNNNNNEVMI